MSALGQNQTFSPLLVGDIVDQPASEMVTMGEIQTHYDDGAACEGRCGPWSSAADFSSSAQGERNAQHVTSP